MSSSESFFSEIPAAPAEPEWDPMSQPEWLRVPHEVAPVTVGATAVVASNDRFAIVVGPLAVYDRGLLLDLTLIRNPWSETADDRKLILGQIGPHNDADGFRSGIRWADGRTARSDRRHIDVDEGRNASMVNWGGGGSNDASRTEWWVWPLPDRGDLELITQFPAGGIPETAYVLDGDAIRAAAKAAQPIWTAPPT